MFPELVHFGDVFEHRDGFAQSVSVETDSCSHYARLWTFDVSHVWRPVDIQIAHGERTHEIRNSGVGKCPN